MTEVMSADNMRRVFEVGTALRDAADAIDELGRVADSRKVIIDAKEAEIARLRETLMTFRNIAQKLSKKKYAEDEIVMDLTLRRGMKDVFLRAGDFFAIDSALKEGE